MFMPQTSLSAVIYQGESTGFREQVVRQLTSPSRRFTSRVEAPEDVWIYWRCDGLADLSHVQNISLGGLFIETPRRTAEGTTVILSFLVREGQVRADGIVRHAIPGTGIGLKFRAVREEDRPYLAALMARIRTEPRTRSVS
jgi:PilZ domain